MRGARMLLVEDNEINQEVAMGQLEEAEASSTWRKTARSRCDMIARRTTTTSC